MWIRHVKQEKPQLREREGVRQFLRKREERRNDKGLIYGTAGQRQKVSRENRGRANEIQEIGLRSQVSVKVSRKVRFEATPENRIESVEIIHIQVPEKAEKAVKSPRKKMRKKTIKNDI